MEIWVVSVTLRDNFWPTRGGIGPVNIPAPRPLQGHKGLRVHLEKFHWTDHSHDSKRDSSLIWLGGEHISERFAAFSFGRKFAISKNNFSGVVSKNNHIFCPPGFQRITRQIPRNNFSGGVDQEVRPPKIKHAFSSFWNSVCLHVCLATLLGLLFFHASCSRKVQNRARWALLHGLAVDGVRRLSYVGGGPGTEVGHCRYGAQV